MNTMTQYQINKAIKWMGEHDMDDEKAQKIFFSYAISDINLLRDEATSLMKLYQSGEIKFLKFDVVELEIQRPTVINYAYAWLEQKCIKYFVNFTADHPKSDDDWNTGIENKRVFFHVTARRDRVVGTELAYIPQSKVYSVYISVEGFGADIKMHFNSMVSAKRVKEQIDEWIINY